MPTTARPPDDATITGMRMVVSALGSAALAGTPYPIDRDATAAALGFDRPTANSLDAVSDRDFAAEYLFCAAMGDGEFPSAAPGTRLVPVEVALDAAGATTARPVPHAAERGHRDVPCT